MPNQDTLQLVTDTLQIIDMQGDTVLQALKQRAVLKELGDGLSWVFFFYAFVGSLLHLMMKFMYNINKAKVAKEPFHTVNWMKDNMVFFIVSIVCGLVGIFFFESYYPPVTIPKAIMSGLLAGTAAFYVYPVLTNPDLWTGIGTWVVNRFKPKP